MYFLGDDWLLFQDKKKKMKIKKTIYKKNSYIIVFDNGVRDKVIVS